MKKAKILNYLVKRFETSEKDVAEWFGYYNYDPLNHDQSKMLCNRSPKEEYKISKEDIIELGYYDIPEGEWHHIGFSDSWNWPQGAMMQWLPGEGNENKVIYNCSKDGHLVSKIFDISTNESKEIDWAIYGITPDGKKSIALDLERSYWCRAYHYQSVANPEKEGRVVEDDGIFEIDLVKNTKKRIISIQDIVKLDADDDFDQKKHWIEHIMISPQGKRFCFLHRYSSLENVLQYETRLCIANIDGSGLQVIPGWNDFSWSHFGWRNDDEFTIYTYKIPRYKKAPVVSNTTNGLKGNFDNISFKYRAIKMLTPFVKFILPPKIIKRAAKRKSYYQHYVFDKNGRFVLKNNWNNNFFDIDGHPSFTTDGNYMITDSYPDSKGYRRFIVFNPLTQKGKVIAKMPENRVNDNSTCDLHPKIAGNGRYVIFDTTYTGKHSMMLLEFNWEQIRKILS